MKNAPPPEGLDKRDRMKYKLKNNPPTLAGTLIGVLELLVAWALSAGHIDMEVAGTVGLLIPPLVNKFLTQRYTVSWERWQNEHLDAESALGQ